MLEKQLFPSTIISLIILISLPYSLQAQLPKTLFTKVPNAELVLSDAELSKFADLDKDPKDLVIGQCILINYQLND
tara:strand:+ start:105 stop:332 length:228 start_codon:yes stop_codon:yes gene_type:complete